MTTMIKVTNYKDENNERILKGMILYINAAPYNGKYEVKFGEYKLRDFTKNDRQKVHCGWYLDDGVTQLSLAHVMSQPKGSFSSTHTVRIFR